MSGKAVRKRLVEGPPMTHAQRLDGQRRVISMGAAPGAETSTLCPLNPKWDKKALDAFAAGRLDQLDGASIDSDITELFGCGAHEVRTWITGLSVAST
jgi:hypothetical protein